MKKSFCTIFLVSISMFWTLSCDFDSLSEPGKPVRISFEPELSIPLVSPHQFTFSTLVDRYLELDNRITKDETTNTFEISFEESFLNLSINNFVSIPKEIKNSVTTNLTPPNYGITTPIDVTNNLSDTFSPSLGDIISTREVNRIVVKSGSIDITITPSLNPSMDLVITFPSIIMSNGNPLVQTFNIRNSQTVQITSDLSNAVVNFQDGQIPISYSQTFSSGDIIGGFLPSLVIKDLSFYDIFGNFENKVVNLKDFSSTENIANRIIEIDAFKNFPDSESFLISGAKVTFSAENSLGINLKVKKLDNENGLVLNSTSTNKQFPTNIRYGTESNYNGIPAKRSSNPSFPTITTSEFDIPNTFVQDKINSIIYNLELEIEPEELKSTSEQENRINYKDSLKIVYKISSPLNVSINNLQIGSDINLGTSLPQNFDQYINNESSLIVFSENGIPIEVYAQIYLINSQGSIFDSLSSDGLFKVMDPATTDANGFSKDSKHFTQTISLSKSQLQNLLLAKSVKIVELVNTKNSEGESTDPISARASDFIRLSLSLRLKASVLAEI